MRRYLVPLIFGLGGFAVLAALGLWQLQRLAWKEGVLAEIEARIGSEAVALPGAPDPERDKYLPVRVSGRTTGDALYALVSTRNDGPGYRVISAFETEDGRRILVDEGFILAAEKEGERPAADVDLTGNLHWPDEIDRFTPEPDLANGVIFGRDVETMAAALGTEPVLVVVRSVAGTDARATPMPVTTEGIPNNHFGYAVQWFGLAAVWLGMTLFLLWRIRMRTV